MGRVRNAMLIACCALVVGCAPLQPPTQASVVASAILEDGRCFEPLADPNSRVHKEWKDLVEHKPTVLGKGAKKFLRLDDDENIGDYINLDYYAITFQKPANKSLEDFFAELRRDFPQLVRGSFELYQFGPYAGATDDVLKTNRELWAKKLHQGAVMSFKLATVTVQSQGMRMFELISKYGEVESTCAKPTDFIFSTVESVEGNKHPVAGHRGFGIKDNGNGTWTFYSKATDRLSGFAANHAMRSTAFTAGDLFWDYFYGNLKAYLSNQGLKVDPVIIKNRGEPDKWPLTDLN